MKNLSIIVLFVVLGCVTFSCSSYRDSMNVEERVRKVTIGMTKDEVVNIMGNNYQSIEAFKTSGGDGVELLSYTNLQDDVYILRFENGRLVERNTDLKVMRKKQLVTE